jgi:3-oxoadipate enol-lactonase
MPKFSIFLKSITFILITSLSACVGVSSQDDLVDFELFGNGSEKVVMLHDWLGDRSNYDPARPYLDTDKFTYAFVDLRGYGGSKNMAGKFTADEAAADAIAVADKLGWDKFHIVGHSMTGMVVQRVAANVPGRIKSLVATSPVSAAGMQVDDKTLGFFKAVTTESEAATQAIGLLTGNRLSAKWAAFKVDRAMNTSTAAARLGYLDMFNATDFSSEVAGLKIPMLALLGQNDIPAFQTESIKRTFGSWYPNLSIIVSPNAGHYSMQETPAFYASAIEAFLTKHGG